MKSGGAAWPSPINIAGRHRRHIQVAGADAPTDDPDAQGAGLLWAAGAAGATPPGPDVAPVCLGRPVSAVTIDFLAWCAARLAAHGFTALLLIWDNASWHRSQAVRPWIRQHNQQVKRGPRACASWSAHCPVKARGLIPLNRNGSMGNVPYRNRIACSARTNWKRGSMPTMTVSKMYT